MTQESCHPPLIMRHLGQCEYEETWKRMRDFTEQRQNDTPDEIWFLEHPPVFTQGHAGLESHILDPGNIPIVQTDRGGQVTYHGPGQLIVYLLVDLKRRHLSVRAFVTLIEETVIDLLKDMEIPAKTVKDAPGVYVDHKKICSLGLRIRRGASYHGLALNVNMDLSPFHRIHPCGHAGLQMTQISEYQPQLSLEMVTTQLENQLKRHLSYER